MKLQYEKCMASKSFALPMQKIQDHYMIIDKIVKNMEYHIKQKLEKEKGQAQKLMLQLDALSPLKTLTRGYAIVSAKGKIVKKVEQLKAGEEIKICMQDGEKDAKIL